MEEVRLAGLNASVSFAPDDVPERVDLRPRGRLGGDRGFLAAMLVGFALLSLWVLGLDLWQVAAHGRHWTGTDGLFLTDQMQFLSWIRSAQSHLLIANLFTLAPTHADLFNPLASLSAGLASLGVAPWLSLLVWKPVAVCAVVAAAGAYVHRTLAGTWARRSALALGLFFVTPLPLIVDDITHAGILARFRWLAIASDQSLGFWSWGYPFGLISLAALVAALVAYSRDRDRDRSGWQAPAFGALASLLHPWQGASLLLILLAAELRNRLRRVTVPWRALVPTAAATALPLAYFAILGRADPGWAAAQANGRGSYPVWMPVLALAPLAIPALLALRRPAATFLELTTRLWPAVALVVYLVCETRFGSVPLHAYLGISLPLAILAVQGLGPALRAFSSRVRWAVAGAAVGLAIVPATVHELTLARRIVSPGISGQNSGPGDANFVQGGERAALRYLDHLDVPGGVLTRFYLGTVVPGLTGRRTFGGNPYYTPNFLSREAHADELFAGRLGPGAARLFALSSGARFVLADCTSPSSVSAVLAPISRSVHRFGCATVFELR